MQRVQVVKGPRIQVSRNWTYYLKPWTLGSSNPVGNGGFYEIFEGELQAKGLKFGIVVSRFNEFITSKLLDGAVDATGKARRTRRRHRPCESPGSFEIPLIAKKMALKGTYNAIICLGTVIRGATPHFEYIAAEVSKGIASASMETGVPLHSASITSDTIEQAVERLERKAATKDGMLLSQPSRWRSFKETVKSAYRSQQTAYRE